MAYAFDHRSDGGGGAFVFIYEILPSVLAEVSFLTNRDEAELLRSQGYRQQIAEALFAGVMKYQDSLKKAPVLRSGF